jgi:site-specific DNA-methyltransferase (adenine-specific)
VDGRESTIEREEFLEWTKSVWRIPAASARQVGHPAPFPLELPERLIKLYSYRGDVVLDPFVGSGTTCVAALQNRRSYVGYETEPAYVQLAEQRIQAARAELGP